MAYTPVPTVVDGDDIIDDWGNAVAAAVTELQTGYPLAYTVWSSPVAGGLTTTSGTLNCRYAELGPVTLCQFHFVFGASSAVTGDITLNLPVAAALKFAGTGTLLDSGTNRYGAIVEYSSVSIAVLRPLNVAATYATFGTAMSSTVPFTWAVNDEIIASFWYWGT
jgi:hypothetical protein